MRFLIGVLLTVLAVGAQAAESISGTTTLRWQAPTQNVDGSPLTDLAGYRIYYGLESRNYTGMIDTVDGSATNWSFSIPVSDVSQIQWYFAMTALNADGDESAYSNEVLKTLTITVVNNAPPDAPFLESVDMILTCTSDNQYVTCTVEVQ